MSCGCGLVVVVVLLVTCTGAVLLIATCSRCSTRHSCCPTWGPSARTGSRTRATSSRPLRTTRMTTRATCSSSSTRYNKLSVHIQLYTVHVPYECTFTIILSFAHGQLFTPGHYLWTGRRANSSRRRRTTRRSTWWRGTATTCPSSTTCGASW